MMVAIWLISTRPWNFVVDWNHLAFSKVEWMLQLIINIYVSGVFLYRWWTRDIQRRKNGNDAKEAPARTCKEIKCSSRPVACNVGFAATARYSDYVQGREYILYRGRHGYSHSTVLARGFKSPISRRITKPMG
ncbi:hypothetical protein B0H14DRAFT_2584407 [Mycena olivaceomarginata]|nr:hypothetical protein B0H14DRAFT_2584407 [Mycena olivaceomarginata]